MTKHSSVVFNLSPDNWHGLYMTYCPRCKAKPTELCVNVVTSSPMIHAHQDRLAWYYTKRNEEEEEL